MMQRKSVLITGASRGIGRAAAIEFAANGYNIYVTCSKSEKELQELCGEAERKFNIKAVSFLGDVGNPAEAERLFAEISELDVVVNNAGISYMGLLTEMEPQEWDRVIRVNLSSVFYICRKAVPLMLQRKRGKIINVSSVWGERGASMECAYSASKGGMNALTKALAKELAPSNIQVNAVACGMIDTQMNACLTEEEKNAVIQEIPADRMGTAQEAAQLIFRLSEGNEYLTGQIIALDGGWQ